jgi:hypothetical protein
MDNVKLEKEWKLTTPEDAAKDDDDFYRSLEPHERVWLLLQLIDAWTDPTERRLEKSYRLVSVP